MSKKVYFELTKIPFCVAPKQCQDAYPNRLGRSLSELEHKAIALKEKAILKSIRQKKSMKSKINTTRFYKRDLDKLYVIYHSILPLVEMLNQEITKEEYMGLIASVLVINRYRELREEYEALSNNARNQQELDKINAKWKKVIDAAKKYFVIGGCCNITDRELNRMASLINKEEIISETIAEILNSTVEREKLEKMPSQLVGSYEITKLNITDPTIPFDNVITGIFDPCMFIVTYTSSHSYLIEKDIRITIPAWSPTWDDWDRIIEVTLIGGHLTAALNFNFDITVGCKGVKVSGCAETNIYLGDIYSDLAMAPMPSGSIVGRCWGCAESATIFGRIEGSDGNCTTGIIIEGPLECSIPILPIAILDHFEITVQITTPCGISIT